MDTEQEREKRNNKHKLQLSVIMLVLVGIMLSLVLLVVWDPRPLYFDLLTYSTVGAFAFFLIVGALDMVRKDNYYGFWTSLDVQAEVTHKILLYLALMITATGIIFAWIFAVKFSWNLLVSDLPALIIVIIASGPGVYFIRKKRFQLIKRKYGRNRLTYFKGEIGDKKEIITTTLDRMKVKYTEQDESSKLQGPKKCFLLPETGMKIYYTAYDLPSGAIIITNIPEDDTLEKQIEAEILRRISG